DRFPRRRRRSCGLGGPAGNMSSVGSLLRLFQSELFDEHMHMLYLHRMEQPGVQDYLVNDLYKRTDDDIDFYLPQLCQIALLRYQKSSLHRFLLDKAAQSMHFALKIHWLVQSVVEDSQPELCENALAMVNMCEAAMVNSSGSKATGAIRTPKGGSPDIRISRTRSSSNPDMLRAPELGQDDGATASARRPKSQEPPSPGSRGGPEEPPEHHGQGGPPRTAHPASSSSPSRGAALRHLTDVLSRAPDGRLLAPEERAQAFGWQPPLPNAFADLGEPGGSWLACGPDEE
ncbi:unnamed protein product, partial [Prorocentrum cordatum]